MKTFCDELLIGRSFGFVLFYGLQDCFIRDTFPESKLRSKLKKLVAAGSEIYHRNIKEAEMTEKQLVAEFQSVEDNFNKAVVSNKVEEIKKCISPDWVLVDAQGGIIP